MTFSNVRRRSLMTVLLSVALMVPVLSDAPPAQASSSDEAALVSAVNSSRSAAGLAPLTVSGDLVSFARNHTAKMVADGSVFHSSNLASASSGWDQLGENVGHAPNASIMHRAFMASSAHKANILGDYNYVGVGAARHADGSLYATVVFMRKGSTTTTTTAPPTTTTTAPPATTTTAPPATTTTTASPTTTAAPATTTTTVATTTTSASVDLIETSADDVRVLGSASARRASGGLMCVSVHFDTPLCMSPRLSLLAISAKF